MKAITRLLLLLTSFIWLVGFTPANVQACSSAGIQAERCCMPEQQSCQMECCKHVPGQMHDAAIPLAHTVHLTATPVAVRPPVLSNFKPEVALAGRSDLVPFALAYRPAVKIYLLHRSLLI